jgi:hypothetical protein
MYNKDELCNKIKELYPDIGECGNDIAVEFDEAKKAWVVDLQKDTPELKHFLEIPVAQECMEGKRCMSLGLEIAPLTNHIKGVGF